MVNRDKLRLMTGLAMYERQHDKDVFKVNKYFRYDYIIWHLMLAFLRYTFCALILCALFIVFNAEVIFYNINVSGLASTLALYFRYYLFGLIIYLIISLIVYLIRYRKARAGILVYAAMLKRLVRRHGYFDEEN